jgi:hypothetical protein
MGRVIALAALATLALATSSTVTAQGRTRIGFWAGEAVPGTDRSSPGTYWNRRAARAYTPRLWSALRRDHVTLYFNLRYRRDFGPVPRGEHRRRDGLRVIREANRHGVQVWGWVLIPYSDGYWAWEGAAAEQFDAVKALVRWKRAKHVHLRGLVLDPEPPPTTPFAANAAIRGAATAGLPPAFQQTIDPAAQCQAWNGYASIAQWARHHHIRLAAAPSPAALDDLADGLLGLQDAAQFILPDAHWHRLFFQAYRSVFAYYTGHDPGPGIVSSYLRSARRRFGGVGQVSIGVAGRRGYRHLGSLVHDVRLLATLGAREVPIYSLERTLRAYGGLDSLSRLAEAARHPFSRPARAAAIAPKPKAEALRTAIRRSDTGAEDATPTITAGHGTLLLANSWPAGCG